MHRNQASFLVSSDQKMGKSKLRCQSDSIEDDSDCIYEGWDSTRNYVAIKGYRKRNYVSVKGGRFPHLSSSS